MRRRRRTLEAIMAEAEEMNEYRIEGIMKELYEVPVSQLYRPDYRTASGNVQKIMQSMGIPISCAEEMNLGEIACMIKVYRENRTDMRKANNISFWLAQLGYWY